MSAQKTVSAQKTAQIGPNALIQVATAARERIGAPAAEALFNRAGLLERWTSPPAAMVDEAEAIALHAALRRTLAPDDAAAIAAAAGQRTADYLLAHRIPRPVQILLRLLPARLAARILLAAIARNAWTFAGSGTFEYRTKDPMEIIIHDGPISRAGRFNHPACDYYAATFEHLFRILVHRRTDVQELACQSMGADACRFSVRWDRDHRTQG